MLALMMILGGVGVFLVVNGLLRSRDAKTAASRSGDSLEDFIDHFSKEEVPKQIVVEAYQSLQAWQGVKDFPARHDDDLYQVYGIWNEDLDDLIIELAQRCGCETPTTDAVAELAPVRSVEDLVRLLEHFYKR